MIFIKEFLKQFIVDIDTSYPIQINEFSEINDKNIHIQDGPLSCYCSHLRGMIYGLCNFKDYTIMVEDDISITNTENIEEYLKFKANERGEAEKKVKQLLENESYKMAIMVMAEYEAKQVFPRGLNIDWQSYNPTYDIAALKSVFINPPKILKNFDIRKHKPLFVAGAMKFIWGTGKGPEWIPENFKANLNMDTSSAAFMICTKLLHERNLANYRDNSNIISGVTILVVCQS